MISSSTQLLALFTVASLGLAQHAYADDASPVAEEHLAELRFEDAKEVAQTALSKGGNKPKDLVRLYMVLGQVAASLGDDSEAIGMFLNALSIDPDIKLPSGVSPKLSEPFTTAKARLEGAKPIALSFEQLEDGLLVVTVESDPANLVGGAELSYRHSGKSKTIRGTGRSTIEIVVPEGASAISVVALDMQGNQLTTGTKTGWKMKTGAKVEVEEKGPAPTEEAGVALHERWQIYAGVAVGALAGGLYLGKTAEDAASEVANLEDGTEFSVAKALEDKADSRALYANISFVGAGLFTGIAYWMYSRAQDSGTIESAKAATLVPTISGDGVGLVGSLRF